MKSFLLTKLKGMTAALVVGSAILVTAAAGWRADATASQDVPMPRPTAAAQPRNADKDRIAELERERDRLLKKVSDLEKRVKDLEAARAQEARLHALRQKELDRLKADPVPSTTPARPAASSGYPTPATTARPAASSGYPTPATTARPAASSRGPIFPPDLSPPRDHSDGPVTALPSQDPAAPAAAPTNPFERRTPSAVPALPLPSPASRDPGYGSPSHEARLPKADPFGAGTAMVSKVYSVESFTDEEMQTLIRVVRKTVEPASWEAGLVEHLPARKVLVVHNTTAAHKQVEELLRLLQGASGKGPGGR